MKKYGKFSKQEIQNHVKVLLEMNKSIQIIHSELKKYFGSNVPSRSTLFRWKNEISIENRRRTKKIKKNYVERTKRVLDYFYEFPESNIRDAESSLNISRSCVSRILKNNGLKKKLKKCVPSNLTNTQKKNRKEYSKEILRILNGKKGKRLIVTEDESWIKFYNPIEKFWMGSETENSMIRISKRFDAPKVMLVVFFSNIGIIHYEIFSRERIGNRYTSYDSNKLIGSLREFRRKVNSRRKRSHCKNVFLHWDNARIHTTKKVDEYLKKHKIRKIPHPPYSPDISPCDFFLFGFLKKKLEGLPIEKKEDLEGHLEKIFKMIKKDTFKNVILEWKKRLLYVIKNNGEYYNE